MHVSRIPRPLEHLFVWSVLSVALVLTWRLASAIQTFTDLGLAIAAALVGYILADFVSGLVHWGFDRMGSEQTPVLGYAFIQPFRRHHIEPKSITDLDFISTNGKNSIAILPFLATGLVIPQTAGGWSVVAISLQVSFILAIWMTNQFHKWAHIDEPNWTIRTLQRLHLVLTPAVHDSHHVKPFRANYCITTGWCNPLLERVRFFPRLERVLAGFGVQFNDESGIAVIEREPLASAPAPALVPPPRIP